MLNIRQTQFDTLRFAAYRERAQLHLREYFPNHVRVAGKSAIRATVDYNLARGMEYGMSTQRSALLYLTTAMMLGSGFDRSPAFAELAEILHSDQPAAERAGMIAQAALAHQEAIAGPNNRSLNRAFLSLQRDFGALVGDEVAPGFGDGVAAGLHKLHAERAETFGRDVMTLIEQESRERAERYLLDGPNGPALFGVMMFFVGWAPEAEPFTPWARETLIEPLSDSVSRRQAFHAAATDFLGRWLERTDGLA